MPNEALSQGFRCGHIDGQGRAGAYVTGEEVDLADEAYEAARSDEPSIPWREGYRAGYRAAAEGLPVPIEHQYPVERKPRSWA